MKNAINAVQVKRYLEQIDQDECVLLQAAEEFEVAKTHFEMTLLRYQALRDFITDRLGRSPYAIPGYEWPAPQLPLGVQFDAESPPVYSRGSFRFAGMKLGDAIIQILDEANGPLKTEQIIDGLGAGGAGYPDPVQPRAVIAALTHTAGIAKYTSGPYLGRYIYRDPVKTEEEEAWKGGRKIPPAVSPSYAMNMPKKEGTDPGDLPFE